MTDTLVKRGIVVSAFDRSEDAQAAVRELRSIGFDDTHIGLAAHPAGHTAVFGDSTQKTAAIGAAAGLGTGALWGIGVLAGILPGVGPAIAGGTLGAILSSAAVGAATAGLGGALLGLGISDEDADYFESQFQAGKSIVTVNAGDRSDIATEVLNRFHNVPQ